MRVSVSVARSRRRVTCTIEMEPAMIFVKSEQMSDWPPPPTECAETVGGGGPVKRTVGRLVDSTQADDRRMISLVRARPLLFARSNLPVASYHSQVKKLWREVADCMEWTVADVRRKWSHIRNSYSRHLRNEIHGVRTGRGRVVSRWYLADELEFLREHMATDTRPCPLSLVSSVTSFAPHFLTEQYAAADQYGGGEAPPAVEAVVEVHTEADDDASRDAVGASNDTEDSAAYFHFFRGIYKDYQELSPRRQRRFRRQCLVFLHRLVDAGGSGAEGGSEGEGVAVNLSSSTHTSSDSERVAGVARTQTH